MTSASARLSQDGAAVALALASFGRERPSLEQQDATMPSSRRPRSWRRCSTCRSPSRS